MHHDAPPPQQMFHLITGYWISQAIGTFAELGSTPSAAQLMDLNMLALLPGRERTARQYADLLGAVGLRMQDVLPTRSPMQVIVASK